MTSKPIGILRMKIGWIFAIAVISVLTKPCWAAGYKVTKVTKQDYWLYEPASSARLKSQQMPLVVYLYGAPVLIEPSKYDRMLREIAASGCVVVLPLYGQPVENRPETLQNLLPDRWYRDACNKTNRALWDIGYRDVSRWAPPLSNLAIVGHSLGGTFALKMANDVSNRSLGWYERPIATPKAIVLHDAAGYDSLDWTFPDSRMWIEDLSGIGAQTSLTMVIATEAIFAHAWLQDENGSGIWARGWHRSTNVTQKRSYVAWGGHFDVYGSASYSVYVGATIAAVRSAIYRTSYRDPFPLQRYDATLDVEYGP